MYHLFFLINLLSSYSFSSSTSSLLNPDSMDYTADNGEFTFSSSSLQQCVNIAIQDDNVLEPSETFSVTIDTSVDRVMLEPNITIVEIVDNDGEGVSE